MSDLESVFCRTAAWRWFARRHVVPRVAGGTFGQRVLEIGCGSGAMAAEVLNQHPEVTRYIATDVDPAMIKLAERQLSGFGDRAEARLIDASGLPFADATFDTVCSWLMLHHTIEWEEVLAEAARVLKPGGRLVGYDLPDTKIGRGVHVLTRSKVRMIDPKDLAQHLLGLGLSDVTVEPVRAVRAFTFSAVR